MSFTPRLYVAFDLAAGAEAALSEEQANYLGRVLRLKPGDPVRLFNGRDGEWDASIQAVERRSATVAAGRRLRPQPAPGGTFVDLWFAPVKKARTDFIVEKATELGARRIRPVMTARTQSERVRVDRLAKIALEAAEQTERLDLPEVAEAVTIERALSELEESDQLIFCDEAGDEAEAAWGGETGRARPLFHVLRECAKPPPILLIGPEGGFTADERAFLRSLGSVTPVSLGPRILRAETAAVAALAVWQAVVGDWE